MRFLVLLLTCVLAACGAPSPVDMTAHYARPDGVPFTVEAGASGDIRVTAGDQVLIRKQGVDYLVRSDAGGSYATRVVDYLAAIDAGPVDGGGGARQPDYVSVADGTATVAGYPATRWKVHPKNVPSLPAVEAILSDDPALAGIGQGVAMHAGLLMRRNARIRGGKPGKLETAILNLYDRGAVLRFGDVFELDRVEATPLSPDRFTLPPVIAGNALKARLAAQP